MAFRNLAPWDRALRIVLGAAMLLGGWTGTLDGVWGVALTVFGWVPLVTGLLGWCPVYALLGVSSLKRRVPPS
jgi:hypothetical protein